MFEQKTCLICQTEYRVTWVLMGSKHEDSQTCICGHMLASWSGKQTARFDVIDKYGVGKLERSKAN